MLLLTSACEPPSIVNSDSRYMKDVTVVSSNYTDFICMHVCACLEQANKLSVFSYTTKYDGDTFDISSADI